MNASFRILLAALLVGPGLAMAAVEPKRSLTVGYYDFPPAIYSDTAGQARGPLVDLTRAVIERAGYAASFRALPSARLYAGLRDGSIDVWPGAPGKPELAADTLEGEATLTHISLNLYHRADTPPPTLPQGLAGRGVIVINGYNYWPGVNRLLHDPALNIRLHRTSSHTSALQMLTHRRADFLLDYQVPVNQAQQQLRMAPLPYQRLHHVPIRFIASRRVPDTEAVLQALDRAYAELVAAGVDTSLPGE
ncbi:substrate-binding periplasmic protein [Stutzerimonas marianensis]